MEDKVQKKMEIVNSTFNCSECVKPMTQPLELKSCGHLICTGCFKFLIRQGRQTGKAATCAKCFVKLSQRGNRNRDDISTLRFNVTILEQRLINAMGNRLLDKKNQNRAEKSSGGSADIESNEGRKVLSSDRDQGDDDEEDSSSGSESEARELLKRTLYTRTKKNKAKEAAEQTTKEGPTKSAAAELKPQVKDPPPPKSQEKKVTADAKVAKDSPSRKSQRKNDEKDPKSTESLKSQDPPPQLRGKSTKSQEKKVTPDATDSPLRKSQRKLMPNDKKEPPPPPPKSAESLKLREKKGVKTDAKEKDPPPPGPPPPRKSTEGIKSRKAAKSPKSKPKPPNLTPEESAKESQKSFKSSKSSKSSKSMKMVVDTDDDTEITELLDLTSTEKSSKPTKITVAAEDPEDVPNCSDVDVESQPMNLTYTKEASAQPKSKSTPAKQAETEAVKVTSQRQKSQKTQIHVTPTKSQRSQRLAPTKVKVTLESSPKSGKSGKSDEFTPTAVKSQKSKEIHVTPTKSQRSAPTKSKVPSPETPKTPKSKESTLTQSQPLNLTVCIATPEKIVMRKKQNEKKRKGFKVIPQVLDLSKRSKIQKIPTPPPPPPKSKSLNCDDDETVIVEEIVEDDDDDDGEFNRVEEEEVEIEELRPTEDELTVLLVAPRIDSPGMVTASEIFRQQSESEGKEAMDATPQKNFPPHLQLSSQASVDMFPEDSMFPENLTSANVRLQQHLKHVESVEKLGIDNNNPTEPSKSSINPKPVDLALPPQMPPNPKVTILAGEMISDGEDDAFMLISTAPPPQQKEAGPRPLSIYSLFEQQGTPGAGVSGATTTSEDSLFGDDETVKDLIAQAQAPKPKSKGGGGESGDAFGDDDSFKALIAQVTTQAPTSPRKTPLQPEPQPTILPVAVESVASGGASSSAFDDDDQFMRDYRTQLQSKSQLERMEKSQELRQKRREEEENFPLRQTMEEYSTPPAPLVLCPSRLNRVELQKLKDLCGLGAEGRIRIRKEYEDDVSHLIIRLEKERVPQTMKYLWAIADKKWIVVFDWVEECLKEGRLVDEEPYETSQFPDCDRAVRLSRLSPRQLFQGMKFYFPNDLRSAGAPLHDCQTLVEKMGGEVLEEPNSSSPILIIGDGLTLVNKKLVQECCRSKGWLIVGWTWVLDSLLTFSLLPFTRKHILSPFDLKIPIRIPQELLRINTATPLNLNLHLQ